MSGSFLGSDAVLPAAPPPSPFAPGYAPQQFSTLPVPNTRATLYQLTLRESASGQLIQGYTFPISPQMLRKESVALTALHDVQGPAYQGGVARQVDQFGQSPPIFQIQGTTGWRLHSADGFSWDGITSIRVLQGMLFQFARLNQSRAAANDPNLVTLTFSDYFMDEHWIVVPIGPQGILQDARSPLWAQFRFRLAAVRNLAWPPISAAQDPVTQPASDPVAAAQSGAAIAVGGLY